MIKMHDKVGFPEPAGLLGSVEVSSLLHTFVRQELARSVFNNWFILDVNLSLHLYGAFSSKVALHKQPTL